MIIDPNSPSWRERMEADIRQAIISSGGVLPIQTNPSWKARIEELVNVFTYLIIPANGSITNLQIAANAAIAWSKISKVGALPGDVGAATAAQGAIANTALQPGAIGVTVQAFSGELVTIAALAPSSGQFLRRGASAWQSVALIATDIPNLDSNKVTTGIFDNARINWALPDPIGATTPNAGTFTSLIAASGVIGSNAATGPSLIINGTTGAGRDLNFRSGGVGRWTVRARSDDDFEIVARTDLGATIDSPMIISRLAGSAMTLSRPVTFTGAITSKNINSTGTRIGLAPLSAPAGGGFRYDYTAGASVALTFVGPSSNIQFAHGAAGVGASSIFNSGGSLALQWDAATATAQGNVLLGTGTNNSLDRLQVDGNISLNGAFKHTGSQAGFYAATAIAKPTVSGSRSSGAALTSLLSALSSLGLITDTTTA